MRSPLPLLLALTLAGLPGLARAQDTLAPPDPGVPDTARPAGEPEAERPPPPPARRVLDRLTVINENDKYAGTDRFYTNGVKLAYQRDDVGVVSQWVSDTISLIPFLKAEPLSYGWVVGHNIYTPEDTEQTLLIQDDRPYGAWLYAGVSLTRGTRWEPGQPKPPFLFQDRIVLNAGVIGTNALGEQVQNNWHRVINVATSKGWHNQLKSEAAVQLYLQRKWLLDVWPAGDWGFGADFLPHFGGAAGNVFTHLSMGGTFRMGFNLGADFGPAQRIASAGLDALEAPDGWKLYVFARVEARAVLFNAFLDGNLFRSPVRLPGANGGLATHDIHRERFVADFEVGLVLQLWNVNVGITSVTRTREFEEQGDSFTFGAFHVALTF